MSPQGAGPKDVQAERQQKAKKLGKPQQNLKNQNPKQSIEGVSMRLMREGFLLLDREFTHLKTLVKAGQTTFFNKVLFLCPGDMTGWIDL